MFKDLKEYQEITQLYHDSVNISEEQREINKLFFEADFTAEEIQYLDENLDELWDSEFSILIKEEVSDLTEEQINELVLPAALPLIKKGVKAVAKRLPTAVKTGVKDIASGAKTVAGNVINKAKPVLKKAVNVVKRLPGVALPVAAVTGVAAGINKLRNIGKDKRIEAEKKKIPSTDEIRKNNPNVVPGTRVNEIGQKSDKPSEGDFKKDFPDKKPEKKMHSIEKQNRARLGDEKVDKLKAKNADFKLMRKGTMSKDDFIKKYPNSITAQKSKGLRDHTEWDAYDMVLEYLFSTEQVTSLEEANYVMMEMEQQTIGEIVKEVEGSLIEEGLAKAAMKLGGLIGGAYALKKGAEKLGTMHGTTQKQKKKKGGLIQKLKDRKDATNKAIEQM